MLGVDNVLLVPQSLDGALVKEILAAIFDNLAEVAGNPSGRQAAEASRPRREPVGRSLSSGGGRILHEPRRDDGLRRPP